MLGGRRHTIVVTRWFYVQWIGDITFLITFSPHEHHPHIGALPWFTLVVGTDNDSSLSGILVLSLLSWWRQHDLEVFGKEARTCLDATLGQPKDTSMLAEMTLCWIDSQGASN
jgi:hypothetical protein